MSFETGLRFILFLLIFGFTNYFIMLIRYENDLRNRKILQKHNISNLYPKGTFIHL